MVRLLYLITAGLTHYPPGSPFTPGELYEGRAGGGAAVYYICWRLRKQLNPLITIDCLLRVSSGCDVVCSQVMLERERAGWIVDDFLEECWALIRTRPRGRE